MKIESIIRRPGGSKIDFGKTRYHFEQQEDGRHIAEVADLNHARRLLAIPEGYRAADPKEKLPPAEWPLRRSATPNPPPPTVVLKGSSVHPPKFIMPGGTEVTLEEAVKYAVSSNNIAPSEWNNMEPDERHLKIDEALDAMAAAEAGLGDDGNEEDDAGNGVQDDDLDAAQRAAAEEAKRNDLTNRYEAAFGKLPHPNMLLANLEAKVLEKESEQGEGTGE